MLTGCDNRAWSPEHFAFSLVDSGGLESASAMITNIFKYRADLERYYRAADETANIRQDFGQQVEPSYFKPILFAAEGSV